MSWGWDDQPMYNLCSEWAIVQKSFPLLNVTEYSFLTSLFRQTYTRVGRQFMPVVSGQWLGPKTQHKYSDALVSWMASYPCLARWEVQLPLAGRGSNLIYSFTMLALKSQPVGGWRKNNWMGKAANTMLKLTECIPCSRILLAKVYPKHVRINQEQFKIELRVKIFHYSTNLCFCRHWDQAVWRLFW
jgi:hypothetical protein